MDYQIIIDDYIGDWWSGTDKQSIRQKLASYKGKHVDVKISSLGGSLDDGLDIRQQFLDHGDVTAFLHGFVASAATVIAMGAKKIVMGKYALFLVHQCSNYVFEWGQMNATELQELIDRLQKNKEDNEKIDMVLAAMYASRCKNHTQEELLDLIVGQVGRIAPFQDVIDGQGSFPVFQVDQGGHVIEAPVVLGESQVVGTQTVQIAVDQLGKGSQTEFL